MKLYSYWRSSASYRVRIALNLKALDYEVIPIDPLRDGGEQFQQAYQLKNPQGIIPTLEDGDVIIGQSLAIIDYLDGQHPAPPLYPKDRRERAFTQHLALAVACDIHPLNNLRVLKYIKNDFNLDDDMKDAWYAHWITSGFTALEKLLAKRNWSGPYCMDDQITIADLCLIPQIYNARRFHVPLDNFPTLIKIEHACMALDAFQDAAPERQIDANT